MKSVVKYLALGAALTASPAMAAPAPAGNPVAGKSAYMQCQACHTVDAKAPPRMGPTLQGVYNAKIAARPGFKYSTALKGVNGKWDDATLDQWLTKPNKLAPGTSMVLAGISDPKRRADIIAYLKTLK